MVEATGLIGIALIAFAGGAFGAALGAIRALSFAGLLIVVGEVAILAGEPGPDPFESTALAATGITGSLGVGPAFGPHVAFAGGLAATAFAARRGYLDTDFDYHEAKNVTRALGPRIDVLAVGGVFGVVGVAIARTSITLGFPWDPVAASIVLTGVLHRIAFGYPLVGRAHNGLLNMTPYERGIRRPSREDETGPSSPEAAAATARYAVEPWLPHQYRWSDVAALGALVGVFAAFVTYATGSPLLAFGFAAVSLVSFRLETDRLPVTHHMALPAGIVVVGIAGAGDPGLIDATAHVDPDRLSAAVSLPFALVAGGLFGLLAGLLGELAQRVLYAHADTHLDPPAASILLTTLAIALLDAAGLLTQNLIPTFGL